VALNKKRNGKQKIPPKKMNVLNIFPTKKKDGTTKIPTAPFLPPPWAAASLRFPASIFRRFPRGALPTRPCHSFVHRSQTQP